MKPIKLECDFVFPEYFKDIESQFIKSINNQIQHAYEIGLKEGLCLSEQQQ